MHSLKRAASRSPDRGELVASIMRLLQTHGVPLAGGMRPPGQSSSVQLRQLHGVPHWQRGGLRQVCGATSGRGVTSAPLSSNGSHPALHNEGARPGSRQQHTATQQQQRWQPAPDQRRQQQQPSQQQQQQTQRQSQGLGVAPANGEHPLNGQQAANGARPAVARQPQQKQQQQQQPQQSEQQRPAAGSTAVAVNFPQQPQRPRQQGHPAQGQPPGLQPAPGRQPPKEQQVQGPAPLRDLLQQRGIVLRNYSPGTHSHQFCSQCQGGNSNDKELAVTISDDGQSATWLCFRGSCGFTGGVTVGENSKQQPASKIAGDSLQNEATPVHVQPQPKWQPLGTETLEFFRSRGISEATLRRNGIMEEKMRWGSSGPMATSVAFPYFRGDRLVNIKYRSLDKKFRQVKGAEKVLFGLNDIVGSPEVIIVEGEMDKLALEEAGYQNVVSVPDGAPQRVKEGALPPPDRDTKYSYLWNCRGELDPAAKIVIATDNDSPGQVLAEELSRRLGRERCWRVRWPAHDVGGMSEPSADPAFRKDANHVLIEDGPEMLRNCILSAEPYPIRGLFRFSDFYDEIKAYYGMQQTSDIAVSTGWKSVDEFYRIVPGELTIITGVPNSGKSEWIDALLTNLTHVHGWSFALCSMEKKVTDHARQLLEKHLGVPFLTSGYAGATARMSMSQVEEGMRWLDDCFHLIRCQDDELPSIDWVLDLARAAVLRFGIRGLVIDPYNELDHQRPGAMSETEYVSQMLTKIKRFAQHHDVHVWFVAHPRQMRDWKGDPPNLYDISGSAHFINKCDNGIVVHRNNDPAKGPQSEVNILVRKVRNKAAGCIGNCYLTYDRKTGRYHDAEYQRNQPIYDEPKRAVNR